MVSSSFLMRKTKTSGFSAKSKTPISTVISVPEKFDKYFRSLFLSTNIEISHRDGNFNFNIEY